MSRGPGRVERAIEAAFEAEPDKEFIIRDLCEIVYADERRDWPKMNGGDRQPPRHRQRSVARAAAKVAKRKGWKRLRSVATMVKYVRKDLWDATARERYLHMKGLDPNTPPPEVEESKEYRTVKGFLEEGRIDEAEDLLNAYQSGDPKKRYVAPKTQSA